MSPSPGYTKKSTIYEGRWVCPCGRSHTNMIESCPYFPDKYKNPTDTATLLDALPTTSTLPQESSNEDQGDSSPDTE